MHFGSNLPPKDHFSVYFFLLIICYFILTLTVDRRWVDVRTESSQGHVWNAEKSLSGTWQVFPYALCQCIVYFPYLMHSNSPQVAVGDD